VVIAARLPHTRSRAATPLRVLPLAAAVATALVAALAAQSVPPRLGPPETVAAGIELYRISDPNLITPPGPIAVQLLRIDPGRVRFETALAQDTVLGTETVPDMARRANAIAAVNGGFFLPSGEPAGLFVIDGDLVSDAPRQRGAVAFLPPRFLRRERLLFDQVGVLIELEVRRGNVRRTLPIDAVDSARPPGAVVLFTPRFAANTGTAGGGTEWILQGQPLRVIERRDSAGASSIPPGGVVVSAGPEADAGRRSALAVGDEVRVKRVYRPVDGTDPAEWARARFSVGGVGLLMKGGRLVSDWTPEQAREGFATERHPRTLVGVARDGRVWLITVDGRNPALSLGMAFSDLQNLARLAGLSEALNLDGGGSTTMVVRGAVINHPSDPTGPRKVSDAILVLDRDARRPTKK